MRRAVSLYHLDRYADAEYVLGLVKKLDPKEKTIPIWEMKVQKKLQELDEGDDRKKRTAEEIPQVDLPADNSTAKKEPEKGSAEKGEAAPKASTSVSPAPITTPTPANKVRREFYETNDRVVISVFAKGVPKDKLSVTIEKQSLEVSFPTVSGSDYNLTLEPLFAEIDPSSSTHRVTPTKIEITLKKVLQGQTWKKLEGEHTGEAPAKQTTIPSHILTSKANEQPPSYPTSSKKGVKNWDKVDLDNEDGDEEDGDATSKFFKTLYSGATPDQQRAMMKSFQESGGTVLSTDWSQVGSKPVNPEPPEGMEAKNWNA